MAGNEDEGAQIQGPMLITFDDIILYISTDEWRSLTLEQKQLYWDFLDENYQSYIFVGGSELNSTEVLAWVAYNESLVIQAARPIVIEDPPPDILYIDEEELEMDMNNLSEQVGPLERDFKEEDTSGEVEEHLQTPHVSTAAQVSLPDSDMQLRAESVEWAPGPSNAPDAPYPCYTWVEFVPVPMPLMMPERPPEQPPGRMMVPIWDLPQQGFPMGPQYPRENMWFPGAPYDQRCLDPYCQAVAAPPMAWNPRQVQETLPPSPVAPPPSPAEEGKPFLCAWCRQSFMLQVNLEAHYKHCVQKKQQPQFLLRALKGPIEQYTGGSSSSGNLAGSVRPQNPAQFPPPNDTNGAFPFGSQPQQRPRAVRNLSDASTVTAEIPQNLAATTSAMKKQWQCAECGAKFMYKWQLMSHLRGCRRDVPGGQQHLLPNLQGLAAEGLPANAEEEPRAAAAARPSTSKRKVLYPCEKCGKCLSKYYIATHLARHEGEKYKCLWCGKLFNFRNAAVRHKKYHFRNEEGINCPECGKPSGHRDCFCMIRKITVAPDFNGREQPN